MVVAMGDREGGDDGAGPRLVEHLTGRVSLPLLACGSYPQNFLSVIARARPEVVVLVDAAELGLEPGAVRVLVADEVMDLGAGSHGYPLALLMAQMEAFAEAPVVLLAIQVGALRRGVGLHPAVEETVRDLAQFLSRRFPASVGLEEGPCLPAGI